MRRLSGQRRVGHGGTLDPLASGVLPICIGQGTRVVPYLAQGRKLYRATMELGTITDTYDAQGQVLERRDPSEVSRNVVERALVSFAGSQWQVPPMYSALKRGGKPLYAWARQGVELPRSPRRVDVFKLELVDWQPPLVTLDVECGSGTYIRSLVHDLGMALGCGAHLVGLVRLRSGFLSIDDSLAVDSLPDVFSNQYWLSLLYPIDFPLLDYPAAIVSPQWEEVIGHGSDIALVSQREPGEICRIYTQDGRFIALARFKADTGSWHPFRVFCVKKESLGINPLTMDTEQV